MSRALRNLSERFLPDRSDARRRSREIDAMLKRDRRLSTALLLLGSHGSGKTTFLNQMRLVNGAEFNHKELLEYREGIYDNIIEVVYTDEMVETFTLYTRFENNRLFDYTKGMRVLIQERKNLSIPWENSANEIHEMLIEFSERRMNLKPDTFQPYVSAIDSLWKDSGIQEAHRRRSDFTLYESVKYYFDNIHRIGQLNYLPNNQDILYTHSFYTSKLWGLEQNYFVLLDTPFIVADYSSWYYLRQKHMFSGNCASLYIIGSSDYDRISNEDNCLVESLDIFERFCNRVKFIDVIILFFNKMDLLAEKVQTADIRKHFPEFQGDPHRLEDVQEFLLQSFKKRNVNNSRPVFYHMITAVDTENFRVVFKTVEDIVLYRNLNGFSSL